MGVKMDVWNNLSRVTLISFEKSSSFLVLTTSVFFLSLYSIVASLSLPLSLSYYMSIINVPAFIPSKFLRRQKWLVTVERTNKFYCFFFILEDINQEFEEGERESEHRGSVKNEIILQIVDNFYCQWTLKRQFLFKIWAQKGFKSIKKMSMSI